MTFDIHGNLTEIIELEFSTFQDIFVNKWEVEKSSRMIIFKVFETYIVDFKELITSNFAIWIDGSFISNIKNNPNDIDFVSFIDHKIYISQLKLIENRFGKLGTKKYYGKLLDGYVFPIYPEGHENAFFTNSDEVYWDHQFSFTKPDKNNRKFSKGFIKITFNESQ